MDPSLKNTIKWKFRQPDVKSLIELGNQLPSWRKEAFQALYGNLLSLLEVNVQTEALTALSQFFDPEYRCFTFQDYQLVPTLEEFEKILGFPATSCKPYSYGEKYSLSGVLAGILRVKREVLAGKVVLKNQREGLLREYLEAEAAVLLGRKDWAAFYDVLAILIYGIVLFPYVEDVVDYAAIDVFLAFKKRGQNPTSVVLADMYYSLLDRHSKKGGLVLCCLPVLYRWFTSHVFKRHIEEKGKGEWKQFVAGLKGSDISWCSLARDTTEFIYQLDGFPNVPLIGTNGCITYNPSLALRQLGYPMINPPPTESLDPFVLEHRGSKDLGLLRRIVRAWDRPIKKGRAELGRRSTHVGEGYLHWIQLRVQKVKLPFRVAPRVEAEIPEPAPVPNEEVEGLKAALSQSQQEKAELRAQLEKLLQEKKSLEQENDLKEKRLVEYKKRIVAGDEKLADMRGGLRSATSEIKVRNQDRNRAFEEAHVWKTQLNASKESERKLRDQLKEAKTQLKALTADYENRLKTERQAREVVRERLMDCQAMLQGEIRKTAELGDFANYQKHLCERVEAEQAYLKGEYLRLDDHCLRLQERLAMLSNICNDTIVGLPRRLRDAELAVDVCDTPVEIRNFIGYVRNLVLEIRAQANRPSKKRKKNECTDLVVV